MVTQTAEVAEALSRTPDNFITKLSEHADIADHDTRPGGGKKLVYIPIEKTIERLNTTLDRFWSATNVTWRIETVTRQRVTTSSDGKAILENGIPVPVATLVDEQLFDYTKYGAEDIAAYNKAASEPEFDEDGNAIKKKTLTIPFGLTTRRIIRTTPSVVTTSVVVASLEIVVFQVDDNGILREITRRPGIGGAEFTQDIDMTVKTALAEAVKKASNLYGHALYLWDKDEREAVLAEMERNSRQNGGNRRTPQPSATAPQQRRPAGNGGNPPPANDGNPPPAAQPQPPPQTALSEESRSALLKLMQDHRVVRSSLSSYVTPFAAASKRPAITSWDQIAGSPDDFDTFVRWMHYVFDGLVEIIEGNELAQDDVNELIATFRRERNITEAFPSMDALAQNGAVMAQFASWMRHRFVSAPPATAPTE